MTVAQGAASVTDPGVLIAASAANLAGWHDLHLRSLGFATEWRDGLWLTPDPVPAIFFHAIAVRPGAAASVIGERVVPHGWASVSDPWADLAMPGLGYAWGGDHAWMVREADQAAISVPAGPAVDDGPADLRIEPVQDVDALLDFERTAGQGFGSPAPAAYAWHAPPLLGDPRLRLWRGRVGGHTVGVAMSFADAGVLGIYGVATLPGARRRGYATALTRHAIVTGAPLPAVLQPSPMAERMYSRLGFRWFATFRSWDRDGSVGPAVEATVGRAVDRGQ